MILVTGASGYVGRHLLNRLAGEGRSLRAMIRARSSAHIPGGVEVVGADLTSPDSLKDFAPLYYGFMSEFSELLFT